MNNKKLWIALMVMSFVSLTSASIFAVGDSEYTRPSLRGINVLGINVQFGQPVSTYFKKIGLTENQIKLDARLKLEEVIGKVVYAEDLESEAPILVIYIDSLDVGENKYALIFEVELWQTAHLKRDPKVLSLTSTWSTGRVGVLTAGDIDRANHIRVQVKDLIDIFIKAYLSVKP